MIHVVLGENQHLYGPQLDQMFELRRGALERSEPAAAEIDAFDDERAVYLMNIDAWGEVSAAVRAHPGEDRLVSWMLARWVVQPLEKPAATAAVAGLLVGVLEFCGSRGLGRIKLNAGSAITSMLASFGCLAVGAAGDAGELDVGPVALAALRHSIGVPGRLLLEVAPARPAVQR